MRVQVSISIDAELIRTIDKLAAEQHRNRSNMVVALVSEALAAREKTEPAEAAA